MADRKRVNRRSFLTKSAAASAVGLSVPYFVPASVLGGEGKTPPSDRIAMGAIGTGGMGTHDMKAMMGFPDVQIRAVCDVDTEHRDQAQQVVNAKYDNRDCQAYGDFRELLARDDIDAVTVTTPDHWHAIISIAAADAGKHIYCEKPLTNSVGEGRALCQAVERNGIVLQCGSHERSSDGGRFACELVRSGRIGKLQTIRINLPQDDSHHRQVLAKARQNYQPEPQPAPEGFDFDMWLGHTPKVAYAPDRTHFWWRFVLAHGGGEMTDRGAHVIDIGQLGADKDAIGPIEFEAQGWQGEGLYDVFWDYNFTNTYADGLKIIGSTDEPRGLKFEGTDGWILVKIHGCDLEASDPEILATKPGELAVQLGRSPGHQRNFIDCVQGNAQLMAPAEAAHRTASLCHLNNIAMKLGRGFRWDPVAERSDDDDVNALLMPVMRAPWKV